MVSLFSKNEKYTLFTEMDCFQDEILGDFDSVSEAVEEAQRVGFPGEEFFVANKFGVRVASVIVANDLEKVL